LVITGTNVNPAGKSYTMDAAGEQRKKVLMLSR
jgi:hypothetical protein